jgi:malto-oligosyltrehalose trehalohydrolase
MAGSSFFMNQLTSPQPLMTAKAKASSHEMPYGAQVLPDGTTRFRIWAPGCASIKVSIDGLASPLTMEPLDRGWHELRTRSAGAHSRYRFVLPDGMQVPDPASRFQPDDVHGPSEVIDASAYEWLDIDWTGRPWSEAVIYELHIGTFTPEGTFRAAISRLEHLAALGVTAIEIMPVADFTGARNWGYDGVLLYAPDSAYGRPEDLKALIDTAHAHGIMVLLDVVYNHFGPDGNYLSLYAPEFFTERHQTPWGAAINYDGAASPAVRDFVINNALYWIHEFHADGLRLDAVHAIIDESPRHLLEELSTRVRASVRGREVHLILENEDNEAKRLARGAGGRACAYTAQWNDDVHHVLHVATTGESTGYYADYTNDDAKLARALAEGFAFQGELMPFRGSPRGEPSTHLPPTAFVAFIQNHDQVGNRAFGERLNALADARAVKAAAAVYLLLPQVPMLFMGEEWSASSPFPFFCNFSGELGEAVTNGRRREFAAFPEFQSEEKRGKIPDPQAESTFLSAKLDWDELEQPEHAETLQWYRSIIGVRHREIVPLVEAIPGCGRYQVLDRGAVSVQWQCGETELRLCANLSSQRVSFASAVRGRIIWTEGDVDAEGLGPWSVQWALHVSGV